MARNFFLAGSIVAAALYADEGFLANGAAAHAKIAESKTLIILQDENLLEKYWIERGYNLATSGNYYDAIDALDKAIDIHPRSAEAFFLRGEVYIALEMFREALNDCNTTNELRPNGRV